MTASIINEFYPDKPGALQVRCRLSEGNLTVANVNTALGTDKGYSFATGAAKDDLVIAAGLDTDGTLMVAKRQESDAQPIGVIITEPEFRGVAPSASANAGSYERREATILFFGTRIRTLDVYLAQSDNLALSDFLKACTVDTYENYFMESATQTSRIALKAVTASSSAASTAKIPVLEGFEVGTSDLS